MKIPLQPTPVFFDFRTLLASLLTVAVTISSCGPGNRKATNPAPPTSQVQKLSGKQLGGDQPVKVESMQELERDWNARKTSPSHRRVRIETEAEHIYESEAEQEAGPRLTPAETSVPELPENQAAVEGQTRAPVDPGPDAPSDLDEIPDEPAVKIDVQAPPETKSPDPIPAPLPPEPLKPTAPPSAPPAPPVVRPRPETPKTDDVATIERPSVPANPSAGSPQSEPADSKTSEPTASEPADLSETIDPQVVALDKSYRTARVRIFPHLFLLPGESIGRTSRPNEVHISNKGGLVLIDDATQKELAVTKDVHFFFQKNLIRAQGKEFPLGRTRLAPLREEHLTEINDIEVSIRNKMRKLKAYRGKFLIASVPVPVGRTKKGGLAYAPHWSVINFVDFEDYVVSVVPNEISSDSPGQAIRAQAIAARTYGVYHAIRARERGQEYDLEATTIHQVYGGYSVEDQKRVTPHVDATEAEILTDLDGRVIAANFSANSGGHTCSALECFGQAQSYLQAVPDIEGVRQRSGGQSKPVGVSRSQLTKAYLRAFPRSDKSEKTFEVQGVEVVDRTESQRVKTVRIRAQILAEGKAPVGGDMDLDSRQTGAYLSALGFRQRYLDFIPSGSGLKVVSYGFGHGVGLSQQGATIHAEKGADAYQILRFYYKNTRIHKIVDDGSAGVSPKGAGASSKR